MRMRVCVSLCVRMRVCVSLCVCMSVCVLYSKSIFVRECAFVCPLCECEFVYVHV